MINVSGLPADERIKLMTAMLALGYSSDVDYTIDRLGGSELKEFASHCVRMLAKSRQELNDIKRGY